MISDKASRLVQDIFLQMQNPAVHKRVKDDPEAHEISLLKEILKDLSGDRKHRVVLCSTVERSSHGDNIREAREAMEGHFSHE